MRLYVEQLQQSDRRTNFRVEKYSVHFLSAFILD